jgi:endonuclease/exonuclease/phosphatase family metal-dependent hydrolase
LAERATSSSAEAAADAGGVSVPLAVLNSHLAFGPAGEEQAIAALKWARDWMRAHPTGVLAWCGDLNLPPSHPLVSSILAAGLQDSLLWSSTPTCFPDRARTQHERASRCDYILYSAHSAAHSEARAVREAESDESRAEGPAPKRLASELDAASSDESPEADGDRTQPSGADRVPERGSVVGGGRRRRGRGKVGRTGVTLRAALRVGGSDHLPVVATLSVL